MFYAIAVLGLMRSSNFKNSTVFSYKYNPMQAYLAKCSTILFAASCVSSGSPKAESLRKPSPHEPKPTPGVPTI